MFKVLIHLIQKYLQSPYFLGRQDVCAQTAIFFNKRVSKQCRNYMFGGLFGVSQTGAEYGLHSTLGDFFIK
jgi:hypothetical protein